LRVVDNYAHLFTISHSAQKNVDIPKKNWPKIMVMPAAKTGNTLRGKI